MSPLETLCRQEAARHRAAFLALEGNTLILEVREPAEHLAKALRDRGLEAHPTGPFTLAISHENWPAFWATHGLLLNCGC